MFRSSKLFFVVLIVLIFATSAFAFAAGITGVNPTLAGEGSADINGYTLSNLNYVLSSPNPGIIDHVTFDLATSSANTDVQVSLDGSTFVTCDPTGGNGWDCNTDTTVELATTFTVVASDQ